MTLEVHIIRELVYSHIAIVLGILNGTFAWSFAKKAFSILLLIAMKRSVCTSSMLPNEKIIPILEQVLNLLEIPSSMIVLLQKSSCHSSQQLQSPIQG